STRRLVENVRSGNQPRPFAHSALRGKNDFGAADGVAGAFLANAKQSDDFPGCDRGARPKGEAIDFPGRNARITLPDRYGLASCKHDQRKQGRLPEPAGTKECSDAGHVGPTYRPPTGP